MATTNTKPPRPNEDADKKSPNYRTQQTPHGENAPTAAQGDCHPANPPATPSSAAENHDAANQKCAVNGPQTASKDERERSVG